MIKANPVRNIKILREENKISNGAKILVVDNDKDMCWLIASILREEGYCVDNVYDGESALLKINYHYYEILVLDYKLSGLSGLSILEKARQINSSNETIMISAFGNESVRVKARELGAYAFLDKPFHIDRLKKTVKKALIEQRKRCANEANSRKVASPTGWRSCCTPDEHLGSSGFCGGTNSSSPKNRHPVHIGAS